MTDAEQFRLTVDDTVVEGRVATLSSDVASGETLARAIARAESASEGRIDVDCPDAGTLYAFVGHLDPNRAFDRRGALAALARSRGHEPPFGQATMMAERSL